MMTRNWMELLRRKIDFAGRSRRPRKKTRSLGAGFHALEGRNMLASVMGDFNGDGFDDLAIGVPNEDVGNIPDAGAVNVIYGGPTSGLHNVGDQFWTQDSEGVKGTAETGDRFGTTLAVGDFNGDGVDDLAIGVPEENWGDIANAGAINVLYGSRGSGLHAFGDQVFSQATDGIQGTAEVGDAFGSALATGDFNQDGYDDLAIGISGEDLKGLADVGAIQVLYGSPGGGLHSVGDQFFSQDSTGIKGTAEAGDFFGAALASGDFNGDGRSDLAIGVPGEDWGSISNAGAINVLYGSQGGGLQSYGDQVFSQDTEGILGKAEKGDGFGTSLAAGDFNGDGYDDLAIGVPSEDWGTIVDAGAINVIYGGPVDGLHNVGDQVFSQSTSGIKDKAEPGDAFGSDLVAADFNGDGRDDLAIGVPYEDLEQEPSQTPSTPTPCVDNPATPFSDCPLTGKIGATFVPGGDTQERNHGAVNVLYGSRDLGLQSFGDQFWTQDSSGVKDEAEPEDRFGSTLTAGDFNGNGRMDLVIGVPGERVEQIRAGAVSVLYGAEQTGLQSFGDQFFSQASSGIKGTIEEGDSFGKWK